MRFFEDYDGFQAWQTETDSWGNNSGDRWYFDINDRALKESAEGVVTIYPDETTGSTAWFSDILTNHHNDDNDGGRAA